MPLAQALENLVPWLLSKLSGIVEVGPLLELGHHEEVGPQVLAAACRPSEGSAIATKAQNTYWPLGREGRKGELL